MTNSQNQKPVKLEEKLEIPEYLKLTSEQVKKVYELYAAIKDVWNPQDKFCSVSTLCRYLRARDYDIEKSHKMLRETIMWRKEVKPELINPNTEAIAKIRKVRDSYIIGKSRSGQPVCYIVPAYENPNTVDHKVTWVIYMLEQAVNRMEPGVETMIWIIDFTNYGVHASSSDGQEVVRRVLGILQNHNPERLGHLFVMNTPWWFNVLWWFVSPFLNSVTKNKIHFLNGSNEDKAKELLKYIAPEQLCTTFGGKLKITERMKEWWDIIEVDKNGNVIDPSQEDNKKTGEV